MFLTVTRSSTATGQASDGELFAVMAKRVPASEEAWAEFYQRYVEDFYQLVFRLRGIPPARIEGLVQDTMIQAHSAAHTFRIEHPSDTERSRRSTLAWLGRIAHNLHWSALRQQRGTLITSLSQDDEDDSQLSTKGRRLYPGELHRALKDAEDIVLGEGEDDPTSPHMRLLRQGLDLLPERECDILIATFLHYERGKKQQRLPKAVVKEICERYQISPANLRQLRGRAISRVKQHCLAHKPINS